MTKAFANALVTSAIRAFPWAKLPHDAREIIFARLCERRGRYKTYSELAKTFNGGTLSVVGDYGTIQSAAGDCAILPTYAETGRWADRTNELLDEFFGDSNGTYIDIGANIGLTTIPIARRPNVKCFAFEPEPTNYANLVANVTENCRHGNVLTSDVALFSKSATLEFEIATDNLGDHRIHVSNAVGQLKEETRRTIEIKALPLDDMISDVSGVFAVKIDTQGAEPFVVEGGAKTLARADMIIMEFSPYMMTRMDGNPEVVISFLEQNFFAANIYIKESGAPSGLLPIARVAAELRAMAQTKQNVAGFYADIVARK